MDHKAQIIEMYKDLLTPEELHCELAKHDASQDTGPSMDETVEPLENIIIEEPDDEAYSLILSAYRCAENLYNQCSNPYKRKAARYWFLTADAYKAELKLNELCLKVNDATAPEDEREAALTKLSLGCEWVAKQVAARLGMELGNAARE